MNDNSYSIYETHKIYKVIYHLSNKTGDNYKLIFVGSRNNEIVTILEELELEGKLTSSKKKN